MDISELAELLSAIAALLWPVLGFVALGLFRKEIANAIGRMRKGKILGQEIELDQELVLLQETALEASEEVASLPASTADAETPLDPESDRMTEIVKEAARSPRTALILLAAEIEREARQTLASIGKMPKSRTMTLSQVVDELDKHYGLPKHVSSSLRMFYDSRNKIIHGSETEDRNILSAIDSGVMIFRALRSLPRQTYWVQDPSVTLYSDPDCRNELHGVKGIMLKIASPSGASISYSIYPSTKTHFKKGIRVAWEWSFERTWNEAWYKDLGTGLPKLAWSSSAEFVGRSLDEI